MNKPVDHTSLYGATSFCWSYKGQSDGIVTPSALPSLEG